jgi:flagellar basal-body rod protein FlgF
MENAALIGLSRQMALRNQLDVIANNVANVNTNGFKGRNSRFQEFINPRARADHFQRPDQRVSYVIDSGTPLDLSNGAVERTGNPLDAAIKGDAYFTVQTPQGERYTRNGSFEINAKGELVTSEGYAVVGDSGAIAISANETNPMISADGTFSTSQGQRGKIKLVRFDNPQALKNEGTNLFSATTPAQPAGNLASLEAGAVEKSNVKAVLEMSRLVEVNRSYATIASIVSRVDELRRTALQKLSDTQSS